MDHVEGKGKQGAIKQAEQSDLRQKERKRLEKRRGENEHDTAQGKGEQDDGKSLRPRTW